MPKGSFCFALVLLSAAVGWGAPRSWELVDPRTGQWAAVQQPSTQPIQDPTLDKVEQFLAGHQAMPAKRLVLAWLRSHNESPIRDRGLYLLGQANFLYGDRLQSFYNFDELLDYYPDSAYFYQALQRQFDIADAYLNGYKRRFMMIPMFEAKEEAIEMLFRIQQRSPGSPLAERALLRTADFYYADQDFDLAADAYGAYLRSYPRSPLAARVKLRQAFSSLAQFRGLQFDATSMIDARQQLLELIADHPQLAEEENLKAVVERIDANMAKKLYATADFYRRTSKPGAAAYYYQYVATNFPTTPEAVDAREKLKKLPPPPLQPTPATRP